MEDKMVKDSLIKLVNDILEIHENIEKSWLDYLNKESIKTINLKIFIVAPI